MVRTVVIDDDPVIRKELLFLLDAHPEFIIVGSCGTLAEALILIPGTSPDLVFLDVELGRDSGFDLLTSLEKLNFRVIFVTAYNHYAVKAIKFSALDYLLKPIDEEELAAALARYLEQPVIQRQQNTMAKEYLVSELNRDRIAVRSKQYVHILSFDEILYCQAEGNYTTFYLADNSKVVSTHPIKEYESLLPENWFIRTHQSYLVNYHFIHLIHKEGYLQLRSGLTLPVSARKIDHVLRLVTSKPK